MRFLSLSGVPELSKNSDTLNPSIIKDFFYCFPHKAYVHLYFYAFYHLINQRHI